MRYIESNNSLILIPRYGYYLRNVVSGNIYSGKVYLSPEASIDDFEELKYDNMDDTLLDDLSYIETKEESLMKIGKIVANQVTDDSVALQIQEFYDNWASGIIYTVGQYVVYDDLLYKVITAHTSQADWTPDISASLFARVLVDPSGENILDWVQPDSTNPYMIGDKVRFEGAIYESLIDNNIWSPKEYPTGWKIIE